MRGRVFNQRGPIPSGGMNMMQKVEVLRVLGQSKTFLDSISNHIENLGSNEQIDMLARTKKMIDNLMPKLGK